MNPPPNLELHLYQTRDGLWRVRIDGLPERVVLGTRREDPGYLAQLAHPWGYPSPSWALDATAQYLERRFPTPGLQGLERDNRGDQGFIDDDMGCRD